MADDPFADTVRVEIDSELIDRPVYDHDHEFAIGVYAGRFSATHSFIRRYLHDHPLVGPVFSGKQLISNSTFHFNGYITDTYGATT